MVIHNDPVKPFIHIHRIVWNTNKIQHAFLAFCFELEIFLNLTLILLFVLAFDMIGSICKAIRLFLEDFLALTNYLLNIIHPFGISIFNYKVPKVDRVNIFVCKLELHSFCMKNKNASARVRHRRYKCFSVKGRVRVRSAISKKRIINELMN